MIHVKRDPLPPAIPVYTKTAKKWSDSTRADFERGNAIAFFTDPANYKGDVKISKKRFTFKVYKDARLASELEKVFGRKCAYCDSRFAHVTPKDIEHFRPKSEVVQSGVTLAPGYYWLAGEWTNLLVSCPDCNRSRKHSVPNQSKLVRLGKGTQFPLRDPALRVRASGPLVNEDTVRLLLDPCLDQPEEHLTYDENGLIYARIDASGKPSEMGEASIIVYALQRKALVEERLALLNEVNYDLMNVRSAVAEYGNMVMDNSTAEKLKAKLTDIRRLRDHLKTRCASGACYLGMVRDYIRKTKAAGGFDDLIKNGVDPEKLL